jgi:hypothetical protein
VSCARTGRAGGMKSVDELTDRVQFVESMDAGGTGHAGPVVAATLSPAVKPGLANQWGSEWTEFSRFAMNAVLIATQKSFFHWITLKSSHRVLPSLVDCNVPLAPSRGQTEMLLSV